MAGKENYSDSAQERLNRFGPLMVKARVYNVATEEEIRSRIFDYNLIELRRWWGKTLIWAIKNGHAIELVAVEAEK